MSGPITWRNVTAPTGVAEAGALFQGAQKFFTGAVERLSQKIFSHRKITAAILRQLLDRNWQPSPQQNGIEERADFTNICAVDVGDWVLHNVAVPFKKRASYLAHRAE